MALSLRQFVFDISIVVKLGKLGIERIVVHFDGGFGSGFIAANLALDAFEIGRRI